MARRTTPWTEVTRALGAAIGKPDLPYVQFPAAGAARKAMLGMGFSTEVADMFIEMQVAFNAGRINSTPSRADPRPPPRPRWSSSPRSSRPPMKAPA